MTTFTEVHRALDSWVERKIIPMVASIVFSGQEIVDAYYVGCQGEQTATVSENSIFRLASNTKWVTSVAVMILYERKCFTLDDPLMRYLPELTDLKVVRENGDDVEDVVSLKSQPTIRQLMSHTAGFSYGIFSESVVDSLYLTQKILDPKQSLAQLVSKLGHIPLANQPGVRFRYGVSTDVLGRLIEIWSGNSFRDFLSTEIFQPLEMVDTDFWVPETKSDRLCMLYSPCDESDPIKPGLIPTPNRLGNYLKPRPFESGGAGLAGTIKDYFHFMQMLVGQGERKGVRILKPETLQFMRTNQLPQDQWVVLPRWFLPYTVHGLGFAVKKRPMKGEPKVAIDEFHWGGLAGTHAWIAPRANIGGLLFTQRMDSFLHPFYVEHKRLVYKTLCS